MLSNALVLRDECRRLRLESVQRRRDNLELRKACLEAGTACRSSIELSKTLWCPPPITRQSSRVDMAHALALALAGVGFSAFVVEPASDTALRS
jgi:hypothetical protein